MRKLLIASAIVMIVLAGTFGFVIAIASKLALFEIFLTLTPTAPLLSNTNILVLGVDSAFGTRSDTIMVLHSDPENKRTSVVSVPRDSLVVIPGRGLDKINHAYAYGGVELSRKTIEEILQIEIPYYLVINLTGIIELIDQIGGVTVNVEKRMYYVDYAGGLFIDLQPGVQKLTGKQAMGYLRFRHSDNDFKRIDRQQNFLKSLASQMMAKDNILRSPHLYLSLLSYFETNLNPRETLGLALSVRSSMELGRLQMTTLPGTDLMVDGIYYWKIDQNRLTNLARQYLSSNKENHGTQ
jgi:LCP family protein required for cell wall assembly